MIIAIIKKSFPDFTLDVSLRFGREFVVLAGPNGSGKTTLLRAIAGLEAPDDGRITVFDRTFFDKDKNLKLKPEERGVGYVFQGATLFPWLNVEKNVRFGLKGKDVDEAWMERLAIELDISHLMNRSPARLSGGETQRVALARALAPKPDMLLLDEPFSAVDMELRPALREFVADYQRANDIPVLMVTHDFAETHTLADRVFKLEAGSLRAEERRGRLSKVPMVSY